MRIGLVFDIREDYGLEASDVTFCDFNYLSDMQYLQNTLEQSGHYVLPVGSPHSFARMLREDKLKDIDIFLHPCVRYSDTGNGNELFNDRRVGLLCLFLQPCKEGIFIVLKYLSPILIFFQLLRHCLYDFLLFRVSKDKRYFPVLCNVVYRFHLQIGFCRLQQNVVFFACRQSCLHISLL